MQVRVIAGFPLLRIVPIRRAAFSIGNLSLITLRVLNLEQKQLLDVVHRVFHDDLHFRV